MLGTSRGAIISEFNAREYAATGNVVGEVSAREISEDEVRARCPAGEFVARTLNEASAALSPLRARMSPQAFGCRVHQVVEDRINALGNPNLKAEVSGSRKANSCTGPYARLDVFEITPDQGLCIYDHKTGDNDLHPGRGLHLAQAGFNIAARRGVTPRYIILKKLRPNP